MSNMFIPVFLNLFITITVIYFLRRICNELIKSNKIIYIKHVIKTCKRIHMNKHSYELTLPKYDLSKDDFEIMYELWDVPNYILSLDIIKNNNGIQLSWIGKNNKFNTQ